MTTADTLDQGRVSIDRQLWADAYAHLSDADRVAIAEILTDTEPEFASLTKH